MTWETEKINSYVKYVTEIDKVEKKQEIVWYRLSQNRLKKVGPFGRKYERIMVPIQFVLGSIFYALLFSVSQHDWSLYAIVSLFLYQAASIGFSLMRGNSRRLESQWEERRSQGMSPCPLFACGVFSASRMLPWLQLLLDSFITLPALTRYPAPRPHSLPLHLDFLSRNGSPFLICLCVASMSLFGSPAFPWPILTALY